MYQNIILNVTIITLKSSLVEEKRHMTLSLLTNNRFVIYIYYSTFFFMVISKITIKKKTNSMYYLVFENSDKQFGIPEGSL